MRIKRFEAPDTATALAMVKQEMGDNAVILATKRLNRQPNGRANMEIVAAMDYDLENFSPRQDQFSLVSAAEALTEKVELKSRPKIVVGKSSAKRRPNTSTVKPGPAPRAIAIQATAGTDKMVHSEAQDLRRRFSTLLDRRTSEPAGFLSQAAGQPERRRRPRPDPVDVARWRDQLLNRLDIRPIEIGANSTPAVIALVGATGVGKTTTAAKLAAWFSLKAGARVTLLSMDCYRIGATDQLRTYAKIMRLPCEIALQKKDLNNALTRHRNQDLIIIDTAGKSPFDRNHINELGDWFSPHHEITPYLVVSATSKKEDLPAIFESYHPLAPEGLVLTKLDETRAYASMCQQIVASAMPVSCLCTGQRVPEDFLMASKDYLTTLFSQGWAAASNLAGTADSMNLWQQ